MEIKAKRREFLKGAAVAASFLPSFSILGDDAKKLPADKQPIGPDDSTINVAMIGWGAEGRVLSASIARIPGVRVRAVCDIWKFQCQQAKAFFKGYGMEINTYEDYREMLDKEDKNIDAVVVATPDWMHCEHTCYCLRKGKHVYCEKEMSNKLEEAAEMFDMAIAIDPKDYTRVYTAAMTLREYGDSETGTRYFEELLTEHADEIDDLTRGQALCFLGKYKEAADILDSVEEPDMQMSFLLAGAREYSGQHEEALALLEQYTEEIGTSPEMLNLKGNALCGLGKYKEALACFEQALPLSQDGTALRQSLLFNRIAAVENMRDFKRAKELAAEYAELYPKDTRMERENLFLQTR
jgi:tetratricopeptide (TPR) repeat protein